MNPHIPWRTPNPSRCRIFTVDFFGRPINTVVTATPAVARQWVNTLRRKHRRALLNASLVVGLGVHWRPADIPEAAAITLCVGSNCLIFHLKHTAAVPATLRRLLLDGRVSFVGVNNGRDKNVLESSVLHELEIGRVFDMAADQGWRSMEAMAAEVLGYRHLLRPPWVASSDWDAFWLSEEQIEYACVGAHVCFLLGCEFDYPYCMYHNDPDDYYDNDENYDPCYGTDESYSDDYDNNETYDDYYDNEYYDDDNRGEYNYDDDDDDDSSDDDGDENDDEDDDDNSVYDEDIDGVWVDDDVWGDYGDDDDDWLSNYDDDDDDDSY